MFRVVVRQIFAPEILSVEERMYEWWVHMSHP